MGKKKKGSKGKRRGGKKKRVSHAPKHSLGIESGAAITLFKIATDKKATGASPVDALKAPNKLDVKLLDTANRVGANALSWDNSKYVLAGMGLHWARNKPIVKIILQPADKLVKLLAGRRYGL